MAGMKRASRPKKTGPGGDSMIARQPIAVPGQKTSVRKQKPPVPDVLPDKRILIAKHERLKCGRTEASAGGRSVFVVHDRFGRQEYFPSMPARPDRIDRRLPRRPENTVLESRPEREIFLGEMPRNLRRPTGRDNSCLGSGESAIFAMGIIDHSPSKDGGCFAGFFSLFCRILEDRSDWIRRRFSGRILSSRDR